MINSHVQFPITASLSYQFDDSIHRLAPRAKSTQWLVFTPGSLGRFHQHRAGYLRARHALGLMYPAAFSQIGDVAGQTDVETGSLNPLLRFEFYRSAIKNRAEIHDFQTEEIWGQVFNLHIARIVKPGK